MPLFVLWSSVLLYPGSGSEVTEPVRPDRLSGAPASAQAHSAEAAYRMMGRVLTEGTGEPVRGAVVRVAVGGKEGPVSVYEFGSSQSDEDGNYVVGLPVGTARAWSLRPPPGYWTSSSIAPQSFGV